MDEACRTFCADAGWGDAKAVPIAGDLSPRAYLRLIRPDGTTAILMDSRQDDSVHRFVHMTRWLHAIHASAPDILFDRSDHGLLLLEDLGTEKPSALLTDPEQSSCCIDLLLHIADAEPPPDLPHPDAATLADWTSLADDHFPGANHKTLAMFRPILGDMLSDVLTDKSVTVSLRDFHVDNLLWLPDRSGLSRLGILDYQDAFLTHPIYDLVSLLTDARQDVPKAIRQDMLSRYAARQEEDVNRLRLAFDVLSFQRNLRILGIFSRAASRDGKTHHLDKIPRVHGYVMEAMDNPVFDPWRDALKKALPL